MSHSLLLLAVNDSCLVIDKRIVIDIHYQTNDPSIMAAGPLTKYSRQYHADQWYVSAHELFMIFTIHYRTHADFNSKEVGQKVTSKPPHTQQSLDLQ